MTQKPLQITSTVRTGSKANCAEFFGVSLPTVESWIRKGMPIVQRGAKGVAWVIDLCAAAKWHFSNSEEFENNPNDMSPSDRDKWFRSEKNKHELEVLTRELIPRHEVERDVSTAWAAVASDLRAIPDKLERRLGIASDVTEEIERELHEITMAMYERMAEFVPTAE